VKIWALFLVISISTNVNAQCNFITANYIKELANPSHIKSLSVKVPKSANFAKNALKIFTSNTINIPPKLKKKFNASITIEYNFGNCNFKAKIRQSGDWKDHIALIEGNPLQSLDIKLSEGNIINTTKFKLLIPKTRNGRNEILATLILKELGFISPETFEVNVNINGVQSVMLFQEKAAKELLEKNLRREGPIFEGDESLLWSYQNYENFELEPISLARLVNGNWFDKGSTSQRITIGAFEQLQKSYLDYAYSKMIENNHYAIYPNYGKNKIFSNYHFVVLAMNGNHALRPHNRQYFFNSIEGYFEPIYYDGDVSFNTQSFCCENEFDLFAIKPSKNFTIQAMKLETSKSLKKKFVERTKFDQNSEIFFVESMKQFTKNLVALNSLIKPATKNVSFSKKTGQNYSWYKKFQTEKKVDQNIISQVYIDKLKSQILLDNGSSSKISTASFSKILTKNSLDNERFVILPLTTKEVSNEKYKVIKIDAKIIRVSKNMQVKLNKSNKQIQFIQSDPADWALLLGGDYSDWSLVFSGKKNYNKTFNPPEQRFNELGLTGCLTFYKTKINNTQITVNNGECEDSVNFIRSFGEGVIITVKDSFADAVDADFSQLTISDLKVINAGNDCLDVSSGNYLLNSARLTNCKDKAISVGEMSIFRGNIISVDKAKIGVSSKDFSQTIINTLNLNEVVLCGESKRKKQEFGGARLQIFDNNCALSFEQDSESIILNSNS